MAIVINALDVIRNKKRLPVEAFFVDANVIIDYVDPLGRSLDPIIGKRNAEISEVLGTLKGQGLRRVTTVSVATEYYKHIQINCYFLFRKTGDKKTHKGFDVEEFKRMRDQDLDFIVVWDHQMKVFKSTFTKKFPLHDISISSTDIVNDFLGSNCDFGDHVLFKATMAAGNNMHCIFSNDSDFYSFPDELFLLTTYPKVIARARDEKKLFVE